MLRELFRTRAGLRSTPPDVEEGRMLEHIRRRPARIGRRGRGRLCVPRLRPQPVRHGSQAIAVEVAGRFP